MKKIVVLLLILALSASSLIVFLPVRAETRTIVVPDNYPTIASAIGNATNGDTIFIKDGTYDGPINQTLEINKSISIIGQNPETTIINLHAKYNLTMIVATPLYQISDAIYIHANDVKLINLTLNFIGNIRASGDRIELLNNKITPYSTTTGIIINGSNCNVANNTVFGQINLEGTANSITQNNLNILSLQSANYNLISSNILSNYLDLTSSNFNSVYNNNLSYTIFMYNSNNNSFHRNYVEVDLWSIDIEIRPNSHNNTFYNNLFSYDYPDHHYNSDFEPQYNNKTLVTIDTTADDNFWDNGAIGNYWENYQIKYPNASEIDHSGIGDTPYKIDANNIDHYPLINPIFQEENLNKSSPEPYSTATVAFVAAAASAIAVCAGLIVYFKKYHH